MLINGFILTSLCKVYFLQSQKKHGIFSNIIYNASVNSKCYHPSDDPGAFYKNFCLGQGVGHLT